MAIGLLPPVVAELLMDIHEFEAGATKAETRMKTMSESGSGAFDKLGKATTLAAVGIGIASVKMAADFETQMTRLYTAAGAPKDQVKAATGEVLKLGDAVGFSGTQIAEALYHPVSAGLDLKTSLEAVKYSAEEAQISGASLDDTTYSLSSVMKAFGINASGAHDTMALLNAIVGQGDMRFQDFNVSIKNWAPTAAQMGISIQSMGAALAYLTDRGNSAEEASTRVTMGLTMMAYPSQKAAKMLEGLGVASTDVSASSEYMTSVLRKTGITQNQLASDLAKPDGIYVALTHLKTALHNAGVEGTEADSVMSKVFGGGRSDKAILSLLQNLDGLKTKYEQIGGAVGQFDQAWTDTQATFSFKLKQLGADTENLGIKIGNVLIPVIEGVVGWFARNKVAAEALAVAVGIVLAASVLKFAQTVTTNMLTAIDKAITGLRSMATSAKTTAAETEGASVATGNWATKLGGAVPVIGAVLVGAGMLGKKLGELAGVGDHTAIGADKLTTALAGIAGKGTGAADQIAQLGVQLGMMGQRSFTPIQGLKDYDAALARLVTSGDAADAKAVIDKITAATDAHGKALVNAAADFPQYYAALQSVAAGQAVSAVTTDKSTDSTNANTDALGSNAGAMNDASTAAAGLKDSINGVDDAYSNLKDHLQASGTLHEFQKDLLSVKDELKQNGKAFNETSLDGLKNMESFRQAAQAIVNYRDESVKNGTVIPDVANKTAAAQAQALLDTYEKLGVNKQAVEDYAKQLGLVPTNLTTDLQIKELGLDDAIRKLNEINAKRLALGSTIVMAGPGGGRAVFAAGGPVRGPGNSTSDSIEARLSNGEYVINAAAASRLGVPLLNALNTGTLQGLPSAPAAGSGGGGGVVVVNKIYLDGREISGRQRTETLKYDLRNSGNNLSLAGRGFQ